MLNGALSKKKLQAANRNRDVLNGDNEANDDSDPDDDDDSDDEIPDDAHPDVPVVANAVPVRSVITNPVHVRQHNLPLNYNKDQNAHQLLFVLLGQVIQLLCVRRLTRQSLDIANKTLLAYNTLFIKCFPTSWVYNQHFNGSHLAGSIYSAVRNVINM
jgi:hypothetical protein